MLPLVELSFTIGHIKKIINTPHKFGCLGHLIFFCLIKSICNLLTQHLKIA